MQERRTYLRPHHQLSMTNHDLNPTTTIVGVSFMKISITQHTPFIDLVLLNIDGGLVLVLYVCCVSNISVGKRQEETRFYQRGCQPKPLEAREIFDWKKRSGEKLTIQQPTAPGIYGQANK